MDNTIATVEIILTYDDDLSLYFMSPTIPKERERSYG